jgi:hypothetical protein
MHSIRQRRWKAGSCRKTFSSCGEKWKSVWANVGRREYVQVLRLLETFSLPKVAAAVRQALHFPIIAFDAVKNLLLCAIERRAPKLDLENYPHYCFALHASPLSIMAAVALTTRAADYQVLLAEDA